jgi:hypothetical protein
MKDFSEDLKDFASETVDKGKDTAGRLIEDNGTYFFSDFS